MTHAFGTGARRALPVALAVLLALMLVATSAFATGILDQSQTELGTASGTVGSSITGEYVFAQAQTFTAGASGSITQVDLYLNHDRGSTDPITVEIRDVDTNGSPGPNILASASLTIALDAPGWYSFLFSAPQATVTAGTQYAIVASTEPSGVYNWYGSPATDPYPMGSPLSSPTTPPSIWDPWVPGYDLAFKTYVNPPADLSLTMVGPQTVSRKSAATYILTVRNAGPNTATNVKLTDNLPYGVQLTAVTTSQGTCTQPSKGVTTVTCNLGDIASGGDSNSAVTVKIQAQMASNANLNFVANVRSDTLDLNPDNNNASWSSSVSK